MQIKQKKVKTLLDALPYIKQFSGKIIVIKYGGSAQTSPQLQEKFAQDITNQTKLMDDIAKIFITIELSTPSIYAIAIKLSLGSNIY